jgi:hypothetical protein
MHPRLRAMLSWTGAVMSELRSPVAEGPLPCSLSAAAPTSKEFLRVLRAQLEPVRDDATMSDPTTTRRFGILRV